MMMMAAPTGHRRRIGEDRGQWQGAESRPARGKAAEGTPAPGQSCRAACTTARISAEALSAGSSAPLFSATVATTSRFVS